MDYLDDPYWNIHQVIAWVYTGDRALVGEVADDAPAGTFWQEHPLPNGDREWVKVESDDAIRSTFGSPQPCTVARPRQHGR